MRIVVTGSLAYDYIMNFPGYFKDHILPDKVHMISVSFLVDSMRRMRGGVAGNIAYTLALLGERPLVAATAGQDFGEYRAWMEHQGRDAEGLAAQQFIADRLEAPPSHQRIFRREVDEVASVSDCRYARCPCRPAEGPALVRCERR